MDFGVEDPAVMELGVNLAIILTAVKTNGL